MKILELGRMNRLKIIKYVDFGFYLDGGPKWGRILLPNGELTRSVELGQELDVFLYLDQQERLVATMRQPLAQVGDFAFLRVAWVNQHGAFLSWGLLKDLFVPFREQKQKMQSGRSYIVHVHLDEQSYRLSASAKVERYLSTQHPPYAEGLEVETLVWQKTDLGYKVIVENMYSGLIYANQVFRSLSVGERLRAYVVQVRQDGKIDLALQPRGQAAAQSFSQVLLEHLRNNGGRTVLNDKSPAEEIYNLFGVSKKVFKKAVGELYRQRLVSLHEDGIRLN